MYPLLGTFSFLTVDLGIIWGHLGQVLYLIALSEVVIHQTLLLRDLFLGDLQALTIRSSEHLL